MRPMDPEHVALAEIDLSDPELWLAPRDHRERVFRTLRDEAPVQFFEEVEFPPFAKGPGYFAVTRYDDVWHASRNPQLFCSRQGHQHPRHADRDRRVLRLDDQHGRSPPLPPALDRGQGRSRRRWSARSRSTCARRPTASSTTCSSGTRRRLRLRRRGGRPAAAADHLRDDGHPRRGRAARSSRWTNTILGAGDPDYGGRLRRPPRAQHGHERLRHRARHGPPGQPPRRPDHRADARRGRRRAADHAPSSARSSSCSSWPATRPPATRSATGSRRSPTTPTSGRSGGTTSTASPQTAVEEIVRWATPVIHFRRTATEDTEIARRTRSRPGEKVVLWYNSANRDERDVRRPLHASTSAATPTRRSASAPAGRTSASAPTWPGGRSR